MQFRAALPHGESEAPSSSVALQRPRLLHHHDNETGVLHLQTVGHAARKPPHQVPVQVQPGSLLSIKPSSNNNQLPPPAKTRANAATTSPAIKTTTTTKKKMAPAEMLVPEPINYIKLRRTEESKHALRRNRQVVQEILAPSLSPTKEPCSHGNNTKAPAAKTRQVSESDKKEKQTQLPFVFAQPVMQSAVLDELQRNFREKGQVDGGAVIAANMQLLSREQHKAAAEAQQASSQLQHLLTDIRNDISLLYKFTPLFKIYTRHKIASRWSKWREYVDWHRHEQQRLELLTPSAVHIQRMFRRKRTKWSRARERIAMAWMQWQAAIVLQCWMKNWLRAQAQMRRKDGEYAARVQAAWRGRQIRKQVKKYLQDQLRWLLASLTPTGNLHRLHEVTRSHPELTKQVNYMLTLIAETHVSVDRDSNQMRHPKYAAIAAKHYTKPVEATRRQLFHAVHEMKQIVAHRDREIADAKQAFAEAKQAKRMAHDRLDAQRKEQHLRKTKERIQIDLERIAMEKAELETREYVRVLKTAEADVLLRQKWKVCRREQAENTLMVIEEYQTRYIVAESRRRELASKERLDEVAKREQFRHDQAQAQLSEFMKIMQQDEIKRLEAQRKKQAAKAAEQAKWMMLSKEERAEAARRLELKQQQQLAQQREMDVRKQVQDAEASEAKRKKEELRALKQQQVAQELSERTAMEQEEKWTRRWMFAVKKSTHTSNWQEKREKEKIKYSIDPMHFAKVQQQKEQDEKERRERYLMKQDDELALAVREKENKARYFERCREKKRLRLLGEAKERKERVLMENEERLELERRQALEKAEKFRSQLQVMQELADRDHKRERDRIPEARNRKEMHDEELRQRRVEQTLDFLEGVREKQERQVMEEEEQRQRRVDAKIARKTEKRLRAKMNLRMMKEDVEGMEQQDWEDEGSRLEQLLWTPHDAAAFAHFVSQHSIFLKTNAEVLKELVDLSGLPPFELDYEAVRSHLAEEHSLSIEKVPRKKRKPRKFFYHEFFEDDPILSRARPSPVAPEASPAKIQARERWKLLGRHFFGHMWSSEAARKGYLQMHNQQYDQACVSLLAAVHGSQHACPSKPISAALVRQLARCYFKRWETTAQRTCLEKSLFFFQQASAHVFLLTSPSFLQEIAFVLEQVGNYRHAAEILGGIIKCFPRYAKLSEVIFRGAIVMFALQMYRQAREYLLHVFDARPFGWESFEVLFLVARILQFEGKPSKKLCSVAYEDAFRKNKRDAYYHVHLTWKEWIKAADTWRRFGDLCFSRREFVLAKDAYQLMIKRQIKKPAHLISKRQQVTQSHQQKQKHEHDQEGKQVHDENDWLRLARVCALLNDRSKVVLALTRWFARKSYRERVLEQFYQWPLVRWKLLGMEIPEKVVRVCEAKERAKADAEKKQRQEIEVQRQQILMKRNIKSRAVMMAWQEEEEEAKPPAADASLPVSTPSADIVQPWTTTAPTVVSEHIALP